MKPKKQNQFTMDATPRTTSTSTQNSGFMLFSVFDFAIKPKKWVSGWQQIAEFRAASS
jgi:hypothetical protein